MLQKRLFGPICLGSSHVYQMYIVLTQAYSAWPCLRVVFFKKKNLFLMWF